MTMFMRMMVMVTMAVAMVMLVMLTAVRRLDQPPLQTGVDQGFYWRVRLPPTMTSWAPKLCSQRGKAPG